VQIVT